MEALYRDYADKGVKFYYVYKALAHPELGGYVQPFTLQERLMHVQQARQKLGSQFTWICDTMDNHLKHALGNAPNSEFVIDPDGNIVRMRSWSKPAELRLDLQELLGPVQNPTDPDDVSLPSALEDSRDVPRGVVERPELPGRMVPLKIEPKENKEPFYVKLRAEVEPDVLTDGTGKMYLGFHLDPLYHVHWNNLVDPLRFELDVPDGVTITPPASTGPKVDEPADLDPREFLVDVESDASAAPLELTVHYFACSDKEGWCKPVTQRYTIHLQRDRDGGSARRSSRSVSRRRESRPESSEDESPSRNPSE